MTAQAWIGPPTFAQLGKDILFSARGSMKTGIELWASDGTVAGTRLVKDIWPGSRSSDPKRIRVTHDGKRAFFLANDGVHYYELWVTDGTTAGTRMVKDMMPGIHNELQSEFVAIGPSSVMFYGYTAATKGFDIYISDGTSAGTKLLKVMKPGYPYSRPGQLRTDMAGKHVYFTTWESATGSEPWITDGTKAGTRLLKDIRPGAGDSRSGGFVPLRSTEMVFVADSGSTGQELWVTDGTAAGTRLVKDIFAGRVSGTSTNYAIPLGNKVLFKGYTAGAGVEPWVTDGTAGGTMLLIDAYPGYVTGDFQYPHVDSAGKNAYWFSLVGKNHWEIFVSDGTPKGTRQFTPKIKSLTVNPGAVWSMAESQGRLYFVGGQNPLGTELCVSDGTTAGTYLLANTSVGASSGMARDLTRWGSNRVVYSADDGNGMELWVMTDGKKFDKIDIRKSNASGYQAGGAGRSIVRFGKYVLFEGTDGSTGREPWISDGTSAGTHLLKDLAPGALGAGFTWPTVVGDKVVFVAFTPATGSELFITDGTASGTRLLGDLTPGGASSWLTELRTVGHEVFFLKASGNRQEVWVTDGTVAGTRSIDSRFQAAGVTQAKGFAGLADKVVFSGQTAANGNELWYFDGKSVSLLKDINPGAAHSYPSDFVLADGRVFFVAYTTAAGRELWVTDLTSQGTRLVKDIYPGKSSYWPPRYLTARNGKVYFQGTDPVLGTSVYVSDGSSAGTKVFHKPTFSSSSPGPEQLAAIGSRKVYFSLKATPSSWYEVWVTDGSQAGTRSLALTVPKMGGTLPFDAPVYHVALRNQVFLRAYTNAFGLEVFTFDNGACAEPLGVITGSTWLRGTDPVLGSTAVVTGTTLLKNPVSITLMGILADRPLSLGAHGVLHFDITQFFHMTAANQVASFRHNLPIPNLPVLIGIQVVFQTLALDANNFNASFELSNGLHWTLGR